MNKPAFRVKPYAHSKYRFVVRAKLDGKWKRSYFENEAEAMAYANQQNDRVRKVGSKSFGARSLLTGPKKKPIPGRDSHGTVGGAHLRIFAEQRDGYAGARALTADLKLGIEQTLRFHNIERLRPKPGGRWRIDPINEPGLVSISRIEVIGEADGAAVYRAADSDDFQHIDFSDGLLKNETAGVLLMIATEADTQMFLPSFDLPATGKYRMEIVLEAHPAPPPVLAAAVAWEKTFDQLTAALEASQAEIGRQKQTAQQAAESAAQSKAEIASQAETLRHGAEAAAQLKSAQASLEASQGEIARQAQALQRSATELQLARTRIDGLETALATWRGRLSALQEAFDGSQAELARAGQQARLRDAQINTLQGAIADAHVHWSQAFAQAATAMAEKRGYDQRVEALEGALKSSLEQARSERSQKERFQAQVGALETDLRELRVGLEAAHAQWNQLAGESRVAQFQNVERQAQTELDAEQIEALEHTQRELRHALEQRQIEAARLSAVVALQTSNKQGLERSQARLEKRLEDISRSIVAAGTELKRGDSKFPGMVELISRKIHRIAHPSLAWRIAKAFGVLRLAPLSVPRTAAERRAIASDLKAGLRNICQIVFSTGAPPDKAAAELTHLFQLNRRTEDLLQLFKITNLMSRKAPAWNIVHWARRSAGDHYPATPASVLFDAAWYLGEYPDVAESGIDPLQHYFAHGAREGRNPNAVFDTAWYLATNSAIDWTQLNPLDHYWEAGVRESSNPSPLFDTAWYLAINPDVAANGLNPLLHYLRSGMAEGRHPHPLFDSGWYCASNPEVSGLNPVEHYLKWGGRHGLTPHPLFDAAWYLKEHPDVAHAGNDPLVHYLRFGAAECRNPHPLFDACWYLQQVGNTPEAVANPLRHYVLTGARERRSPTPLFDPDYYAQEYPEAAECDDLFRHYLTIGWQRGYQPSAYFDPKRYLRIHPEVARRGIEPLTDSVLRS